MIPMSLCVTAHRFEYYDGSLCLSEHCMVCQSSHRYDKGMLQFLTLSSHASNSTLITVYHGGQLDFERRLTPSSSVAENENELGSGDMIGSQPCG